MSYQTPKIPTPLQSAFTAVDAYITPKLHTPSPSKTSTLTTSSAANLAPISVSPNLGSFLSLLAKINNSTCILEIGTLGGYSAIWFAEAVSGRQGAKFVSLKIDPVHTDVARGNISRAGFGDIVQIRVGAALDRLSELKTEKAKTAEDRKRECVFDFVFFDADKENNLKYLESLLGGLISRIFCFCSSITALT